MFTAESFQMMVSSTPIGYAYHKLIYKDQSVPVDIEILNYNPAYLSIVGLNDIDPKNQTMFQLFPDLESEIPGLLKMLIKTMTQKKPQRFSGYIPSFNKWIDIHFFSPSEDLFIAQLIDSTEERKLNHKLVQKSNESEKLINLIPDLVAIIDGSWNIINLNHSWKSLLGYELHELKNSSIIRLVHPKDFQTTKSTLEDGSIFEPDHILRIRLMAKDGSWKHFDWNFTSNEGQMYGVGRDVTNLIDKEKQIYYLSFHDKLTGLYNRAYFEEELKRLDNNRSLPFAIIMGDVNGLKIINDVFGHLSGDKMLISIAEILKKSCRKGDIIARWGGDEFIILLPNTPASVVKEIIHRIHINCKNNELDLQYANISLGYAVRESMDVDVAKILIEAENDMYKNKLIDGKSVRETILSSIIQFLYDGNHEVKYHIDRIRRYSILISKELGLLKEDINKLLLLADTHDIGKISIPKEVLECSGIFNEMEWEEMKKHSEIGFRIAKSIPELANIAELILHHHEHWDGNGYPHGLKGEEIPYLARIFSMIDTFDALTQDKPYRKAMTKGEAIDFLISQKGKQFDPDLVDTFLKIL